MWGQRVLGPSDPRQLVADRDRRDHDRQLRPGADIRPGSMGRPMPGHRGGARSAVDAENEPVVGADGAPSSSTSPTRRACSPCARAGRRCSAATSTTTSATSAPSPATGTCPATSSRRDADGWFWFVGRGDDVIKTAGHLVGPVRGGERADGAPAVVEAGVIGLPDAVGGQRRQGLRDRPPGHRGRRAARARAARLRTDSASAPRSHHGRSRSSTTCPTPAAARSCAGCSGPESSGLPEGDLSTLEEQR